MEPLIPLFWTSWDIYPGFQSQNKFPHVRALSSTHNRFLRFTSGATPADHLAASMVAEQFHLNTCVQALPFCFILIQSSCINFIQDSRSINLSLYLTGACQSDLFKLTARRFNERLSYRCDATKLDRIIPISIPITTKFSVEDNGHFRVTPITICPGFSSLNYSHGTLIRIPQIGSQSASFSSAERSS